MSLASARTACIAEGQLLHLNSLRAYSAECTDTPYRAGTNSAASSMAPDFARKLGDSLYSKRHGERSRTH